VTSLQRVRVCARRRYSAKNKRAPYWGRPRARGTGASADGVRESEDRTVATTVGNGWHLDPLERKRSVLVRT